MEKLAGNTFHVYSCFKGGNTRWHNDYLIKLQRLFKLRNETDVPLVNGVEAPPEYRPAHYFDNLDRAVYVGDIQGDLDASDSAGVPFIHAAYGFGTVNRDVPAVKSFSEICEVFAKLVVLQKCFDVAALTVADDKQTEAL